MNLLVIGLTLIGNLVLGAVVQAQVRDVGGVEVECDGECRDSNLGQICQDRVGRTYRPFAVSCQNVRERPRQERGPQSFLCGGDNKCFQVDVNPTDRLDDYCDDINGWDAIVYCEEVTTQTGTCNFGPGAGGVSTNRDNPCPFGVTFSSEPQVLVTPKGAGVFAVTILQVMPTNAPTHFVASVFRVDDPGQAWENLQIDWVATGGRGIRQPETKPETQLFINFTFRFPSDRPSPVTVRGRLIGTIVEGRSQGGTGDVGFLLPIFHEGRPGQVATITTNTLPGLREGTWEVRADTDAGDGICTTEVHPPLRDLLRACLRIPFCQPCNTSMDHDVPPCHGPSLALPWPLCCLRLGA
jgi:hypothetical protein